MQKDLSIFDKAVFLSKQQGNAKTNYNQKTHPNNSTFFARGFANKFSIFDLSSHWLRLALENGFDEINKICQVQTMGKC